MITYHGNIDVPTSIVSHADTIKLENYKTNTPAKFRKHFTNQVLDTMFEITLAEVMGIDHNQLDYVYFSVCKGAEPHTDQLDPLKFSDTTYVIPVILPEGDSVIHARDENETVVLGGIYSFDHTETHSMTLDDTDSGCVVIMATERIDIIGESADYKGS